MSPFGVSELFFSFRTPPRRRFYQISMRAPTRRNPRRLRACLLPPRRRRDLLKAHLVPPIILGSTTRSRLAIGVIYLTSTVSYHMPSLCTLTTGDAFRFQSKKSVDGRTIIGLQYGPTRRPAISFSRTNSSPFLPNEVKYILFCIRNAGLGMKATHQPTLYHFALGSKRQKRA